MAERRAGGRRPRRSLPRRRRRSPSPRLTLDMSARENAERERAALQEEIIRVQQSRLAELSTPRRCHRQPEQLTERLVHDPGCLLIAEGDGTA
ncbi:hypothetical protein WME90_08175 [Sorangium sp. So ce375]|uniref:hypothetical protein n=1 Tax=Sorangium sp. So ce375 TaxID=3133306 RepID=UPI003F5C8127